MRHCLQISNRGTALYKRQNFALAQYHRALPVNNDKKTVKQTLYVHLRFLANYNT